VHEALRATIDRAGERAAFSLELFDLHTLTLRPLAAALNLTWRVDPALVRFTFRLGVLMLAGVAIFQTFALPHGYWLPFTFVVVLQPDYGSTRLRAGQRVLGTLGGSLVASALLWLELPFAALATASAATLFAFGYFIKRNYAVAVFFITLFIVLLTETNGPVTLAFTVERLALTSAGGALALLAALFFWPVWERDRFPPLLATALRANRDYLGVLVARLAAGGPYDAAATLAKRHAESANSRVFSSLQRMSGDPKNQQLGLEQAATLANGNQRLTRAFNVIAVHLTPGAPLAHPELTRFAHLGASTFDALALAVERDDPLLPQLGELSAAFAQLRLPVPVPEATDPAARRDRWVFGQLGRAATELGAMLLATMETAPARPADLGPAP
jgi:uncharacterized membrane protein YccC